LAIVCLPVQIVSALATFLALAKAKIQQAGHGAAGWQRGNQKEKTDFTTKDTKITKFMIINIRTLRVLRELRGEKVFHRMVYPRSALRDLRGSRKGAKGAKE
jgi:hypothetical protein